MFWLYDRNLGTRMASSAAANLISGHGIENVDDGELWETHSEPQGAHARFHSPPRRRAGRSAAAEPAWPLRSAPRVTVFSPDALTIGFARRFATYKRANLILADLHRLSEMVNDPKRPVQFVFSGKAHPHDVPGKRVLQQIAQLMRDSQFADKFVFIEDYDINVARHLVQGVDVWLNNPAPPARSLRNQRTERSFSTEA